ncbi:hypothetical protein K469DRAFT_218057 [Zopfia rhizophila CBS 207.26]|uniref:Uncharacterized protein n=1 Tax=Zopfia rhizophila CBS 207.26 TaxID=1314779 RepID=A0A6A6DZC8_9PEZI|nr:hypothetical protein K469DRAFT_218057 [Zopfia rhizophila CBS 207.26]
MVILGPTLSRPLAVLLLPSSFPNHPVGSVQSPRTSPTSHILQNDSSVCDPTTGLSISLYATTAIQRFPRVDDANGRESLHAGPVSDRAFQGHPSRKTHQGTCIDGFPACKRRI